MTHSDRPAHPDGHILYEEKEMNVKIPISDPGHSGSSASRDHHDGSASTPIPSDSSTHEDDGRSITDIFTTLDISSSETVTGHGLHQKRTGIFEENVWSWTSHLSTVDAFSDGEEVDLAVESLRTLVRFSQIRLDRLRKQNPGMSTIQLAKKNGSPLYAESILQFLCEVVRFSLAQNIDPPFPLANLTTEQIPRICSKAISIQPSALSNVLWALEQNQLAKQQVTHEPPSPTHSDKQSRVLEDFGRHYVGSGSHMLRDHVHSIAETYHETKAYARVLPILQSSGSGKTRCTVELGKLELGLLVCIRGARSADSQGAVSAPPRDESVCEWLQSDTDNKHPEQRMAAWLAATAYEIRQLCTSYLEFDHKITVPGEKPDRWNALIAKMAESLAPIDSQGQVRSARSSLLQKIAATSEVILNELVKLIGQAETLHSSASATSNTAQTKIPTLSERTRLIRAQRVAQEFKDLEALFPDDSKAFFHLAIDECSQLGENVHRLRRLWSDVSHRTKRSWILLLDTKSSISGISGVAAYNSSDRFLEGHTLPEPFMLLPLDVELADDSDTRERYLKVINGEDHIYTHHTVLQFLRKMGRPLLNDTGYLRDEDDLDTAFVVGEIKLKSLALKLLGPINENATIRIDPSRFWTGDNDATSLIGLACQRLPLKILSGRGAPASGGTSEGGKRPSTKVLAEDLVSDHMRRLYLIMDRGMGVMTSAPSEPLLSLAATMIYRNGFVLKAWERTFNTIVARAKASNLLVGEMGEEYIRMLISAAMDLGAKENMEETSCTSGQPVPITKWLKHLLNRPLNLPSNFEDCYMNFTHFLCYNTLFTPENPLPHSKIVDAYLRHAAIIGHPRQGGWDALLPFHCGTPDGPFNAKLVSYVLLQIRNRTKETGHIWKLDWRADTIVKQVEDSTDTPQVLSMVPVLIWFDLLTTGDQTILAALRPTRTSPRLSHPLLPFNYLVQGNGSAVFAPLNKMSSQTQENMAYFISTLRKSEGMRTRHQILNKGLYEGFDAAILNDKSDSKES